MQNGQKYLRTSHIPSRVGPFLKQPHSLRSGAGLRPLFERPTQDVRRESIPEAPDRESVILAVVAGIQIAAAVVQVAVARVRYIELRRLPEVGDDASVVEAPIDVAVARRKRREAGGISIIVI